MMCSELDEEKGVPEDIFRGVRETLGDCAALGLESLEKLKEAECS